MFSNRFSVACAYFVTMVTTFEKYGTHHFVPWAWVFMLAGLLVETLLTWRRA
jgi:hypothetical protein